MDLFCGGTDYISLLMGYTDNNYEINRIYEYNNEIIRQHDNYPNFRIYFSIIILFYQNNH